MDIFISKDPSVDPTEFANDFEIHRQNRFTLNSANIQPALNSFTAAVRINGANFYNNAYFKSNIIAQFKVISKEEVTSTGDSLIDKAKTMWNDISTTFSNFLVSEVSQ